MNNGIIINKQQLLDVVMQWITNSRSGDTMSREETDTLSVEENGELAADWLWEKLEEKTRNTVYVDGVAQ